MAQIHSFDIVSEVDMQEIDNAVNMAMKEIRQRFDLKDSNTELELNKKEKFILITTKDEFTLKAAIDILQNKFIKRGISLKAMKFQQIDSAQGGRVKQKILIQTGLDKDKARLITKLIKESKLKVTSSIQDEQVRVSGKNIDDLQAIIKMIKEKDFDFPIQFVNYK